MSKPPDLTTDTVNLADANRSCFAKRQFWTKNHARDAAIKINKGHEERGDRPLVPYKCGVCHHFHLTSQPKKVRSTIKNRMRGRKDVEFPLKVVNG